jgi:hypothetical protein
MTATNFAAEARSNSRRAGNHTRRAEADAREADAWYKLAASRRAQVTWLTARADLWDQAEGFTPADWEATARSMARIADTFLRSSFQATKMAAFYRGLAADYRDMAAKYGSPLVQEAVAAVAASYAPEEG